MNTLKNSILCFICLLFLASCGKDSSGYDAKVALDPSWNTLSLPGRENSLTAFSIELIEAIGIEENLKIGIYQNSWDSLMLGLQKEHYEAIVSTLQPYLFYEKLYTFSDIYLATGPVLITTISASWSSLATMQGREVGILRLSNDALILEKYPEVIQRTYDSLQQGLDDVNQGVIDAMIVDILTAEAFVHDLYVGQLKISSSPLTPEGLRLIGLQKSRPFIWQFNRGLSRLKANGTYTKLAQKWGIAEPLILPEKK